ncbi:hypothetical protein ANCCEY_14170 [Ancylostoma ceylanicum]|uniref:SUEL-type lectin domain-containing protein n=1 Tax=Ancylostoma ceylanicum TaxID=53326 RepID=A0A0D6L5Z9_9BILA|nr:hypothetical protein ANCCEY_14170 [Ancylostoma ceylanicum]
MSCLKCSRVYPVTLASDAATAAISGWNPPRSIVVCEGGTAELVCPRGMVISIALANYGRYSARVCYENDDLDDVVPMTQCHNPRTMPTLRKRSVYPLF